ncbi:MAG: hypothetical protein U1D31_03375 [Patescibacteria group bacterium]|nr:hypothetical protein [Patescibacteria group bacterium]
MIPNPDCQFCAGEGIIEIMGDGDNFEWDVVETKPCKECRQED